MAKGSWYDTSTDGTLLNGVLYPGDDNSWWNRPAGEVISDAASSVVSGASDLASDIMNITNDDTLSQPKYDFKYLAFPNDLGMDYLGHYMVININVPVEYGSESVSTSLPQNAGSSTVSGGLPYNILPGEMSKVDVLRFGGGQSLTNQNNQNSAFYGRRTRRIEQSIALYMPGSQLLFNTINDYEEIGLTPLAGKLGVGAIATTAGVIAGTAAGGPGAGSTLGGAAGLAVGAAASWILSSGMNAVGNLAETAAKLANRPINPRVEVIFARTNLREFQFEFLFLPRNAEEAETIRRIVKTLRFHAAPELMTWGFQWIPPAEFDITFFHRGVENTKIPRINTCVLRRIEVDFAPGTGQFAAYKDGNPFATRLMLVFSEVEILHKKRVQMGF